MGPNLTFFVKASSHNLVVKTQIHLINIYSINIKSVEKAVKYSYVCNTLSVTPVREIHPPKWKQFPGDHTKGVGNIQGGESTAGKGRYWERL